MSNATPQESLPEAVRHLQEGRPGDAEQLCRRLLALDPANADALHLLGMLAHQAGRREESIELLHRAIRANPTEASIHSNLGLVLHAAGRTDEAISAYRSALALRPAVPQTQFNLANSLIDRGEVDEAIGRYQAALQLKPDFLEAMNNLGQAFREKGELGRSSQVLRCALAMNPDFTGALSNLGTTLLESGDAAGAIHCYRQVLARTRDATAASNLLYALHFDPATTAQRLIDEHQLWERTYALPLIPSRLSHDNDPAPDRRLRIGYVSPDLRNHPVGRFMTPLLANHNHQAFEIICYSSARRPDGLTDRLRSHADQWRQVNDLSDEALAALVRQDRIDILVDLTMHMAGSRLLAFARKPAPVQVTYLAYCGTTGLRAIDYRLSDRHLDPPDTRACYAERTVHLPRTYWCYEPPADAPPVGGLPAHSNGLITFGCLNNFAKVNTETVATWAQLLSAVPHSRLILHAGEGDHRGRVLEQMASERVDPQRVRFVQALPVRQYLAQYHQIDIALDPFPYSGGTTTCDALWMGVPVISLSGEFAFACAGRSILSNVALGELVASDCAQYVRIAVQLATDLPRLSDLRRTMRDRMQGSPLMDALGFTSDVEAVYRSMWRRWSGR